MAIRFGQVNEKTKRILQKELEWFVRCRQIMQLTVLSYSTTIESFNRHNELSRENIEHATAMIDKIRHRMKQKKFYSLGRAL